MAAFPPVSATSSPPPVDLVVIPPPPPGFKYIATIKPLLTLYTICSVDAAILVPCLFALFFFSTKHMRHTPIFLANVLSVCLGSTLGIPNSVVTFWAMVAPTAHPVPPFSLAGASLIITIPFIVESILCPRLLAVYPIGQDTIRRSIFIFVPLLTLKIGRLAGTLDVIVAAQLSWRSHPGERIECALQVMDNTTRKGTRNVKVEFHPMVPVKHSSLACTHSSGSLLPTSCSQQFSASSNSSSPFFDRSFERGTESIALSRLSVSFSRQFGFLALTGARTGLIIPIFLRLGSILCGSGMDTIPPATHLPSIRFHQDIHTISITQSVPSEAHRANGVGLDTFSDQHSQSAENANSGLASKEESRTS